MVSELFTGYILVHELDSGRVIAGMFETEKQKSFQPLAPSIVGDSSVVVLQYNLDSWEHSWVLSHFVECWVILLRGYALQSHNSCGSYVCSELCTDEVVSWNLVFFYVFSVIFFLVIFDVGWFRFLCFLHLLERAR